MVEEGKSGLDRKAVLVDGLAVGLLEKNGQDMASLSSRLPGCVRKLGWKNRLVGEGSHVMSRTSEAMRTRDAPSPPGWMCQLTERLWLGPRTRPMLGEYSKSAEWRRSISS